MQNQGGAAIVTTTPREAPKIVSEEAPNSDWKGFERIVQGDYKDIKRRWEGDWKGDRKKIESDLRTYGRQRKGDRV